MLRRSTPALFGLIAPLLGLAPAFCAEGILVADQEILQMGQMWFGKQAAREVTIRNTGDAPIAIRAVRTPCACTSASNTKKTLAPGETDVVKINIDSKQTKGIWTKWVNLETDNPDRPFTRIMLKGETLPIIDFKPEEGLRLGRLTPDAKIDSAFELTCVYEEPLKLKLVPTEGQPFEAQLTPIEEGKKYALRVRNAGPLALGSALATFPIETGLDFCPTFDVVIGGFVLADVSVFPEDIYVPPRRMQRSPHIVNVVFRKGRALEIKKIEADFPDVGVGPMTGPVALPDGPEFERYTFEVTVPGADGVPVGLGGKITIYTSDPDYPKIEIPVSRLMPKRLQEQFRRAQEAREAEGDGESLD